MPAEDVIELLLRGLAVGALAATAIGVSLSKGPPAARVSAAAFCLSTMGYALSAPHVAAALQPLAPLVFLLSAGGGGWFWLFAVSLFEDRPLRPAGFLPPALLTGIGLVANAAPASLEPGLWIVHNLIEAALALSALLVIVRSWRGDLVESRRRLRGPFLFAVAGYIPVLSMFEVGESLGFEAGWYDLAGAASLALFTLIGAGVFLRGRDTLFGAAAASDPPAPRPDPPDPDRHDLARLENAMTAGEIWRREGLSIGDLADELGLPEHRLRRLINDRLGCRNFAAFINARRIEAAREALRDPARARDTIAAIAFELGFGSLGPFNRAFRDAVGMTPTEYRRGGGASGSPDSETPR